MRSTLYLSIIIIAMLLPWSHVGADELVWCNRQVEGGSVAYVTFPANCRGSEYTINYQWSDSGTIGVLSGRVASLEAGLTAARQELSAQLSVKLKDNEQKLQAQIESIPKIIANDETAARQIAVALVRDRPQAIARALTENPEALQVLRDALIAPKKH